MVPSKDSRGVDSTKTWKAAPGRVWDQLGFGFAKASATSASGSHHAVEIQEGSWEALSSLNTKVLYQFVLGTCIEGPAKWQLRGQAGLEATRACSDRDLWQKAQVLLSLCNSSELIFLWSSKNYSLVAGPAGTKESPNGAYTAILRQKTGRYSDCLNMQVFPRKNWA